MTFDGVAIGGLGRIGQKILNGMGRNIPGVLRLSRNAGNECEWADTGYSYQDAQRLARVWRLSDPYHAKIRAAKLFTDGRSRAVERALGR